MFENSTKFCELPENPTVQQARDKFRSEFNFYGPVNVVQWSCKYNEWLECNDVIKTETENPKVKFIRSTRSTEDLLDTNCVVFCCDIQERFRSAIKYFDEIVQIAGRVLKASQILQVPLIVTEQYPKGLLKTVSELDISHAKLVLEKTKFTMMNTEVEQFLSNNSYITHVIIVGVEAHVCIQQTVLDLIDRGLKVLVVSDAVSSRSLADKKVAIRRLRSAGAIITTTESVLFQMIRDKNHPKFKEIQNIIKVLPPEVGILAKV